MRLLDNLEGVTAETFPKHPISILVELLQQHQCELTFEFREEIQGHDDAAHDAYGSCMDFDSKAADGQIVFFGIAKIKDKRAAAAAAAAGGTCSHLVAISEEKSAATKRAVRAQCAEQVLLSWDLDPTLLQVAVLEARTPVVGGNGKS